MVTVRGSTVRNRQIVNSRGWRGNIGNIMEIFHGNFLEGGSKCLLKVLRFFTRQLENLKIESKAFRSAGNS